MFSVAYVSLDCPVYDCTADIRRGRPLSCPRASLLPASRKISRSSPFLKISLRSLKQQRLRTHRIASSIPRRAGASTSTSLTRTGLCNRTLFHLSLLCARIVCICMYIVLSLWTPEQTVFDLYATGRPARKATTTSIVICFVSSDSDFRAALPLKTKSCNLEPVNAV